MPTYRYRCGAGHEFEEWASINADSSTAPCAVHARDAVKVMVPPRLAMAATPNRTRASAPPADPKNSWERGIAKDDRGVPLIDNGNHIPVKKYAANRQKYEARRKELRHSPDPFGASQALV